MAFGQGKQTTTFYCGLPVRLNDLPDSGLRTPHGKYVRNTKGIHSNYPMRGRYFSVKEL
jgi:hypothetical protein